MKEKINNEEILGIFNGFQGQIAALKFTFTGKCLKIIFTTKRLIIAEENVGLIKRISWSHDYNCVTADETEMSKMRQKTIYDFIDKTKILSQISHRAIKEIHHKPSADVYRFTIHMDKSDEKIRYDIPIRGNKEKNKKIFKEFFNTIITKAVEERFNLMDAIIEEEPRIIKSILESGVDVDFALKNGVTPLMIAAEETNNSKVIEVLIEGGANVNAQAEGGYTPLMAASAENSNPEIIEKLISSGANVNAIGDKGITPLLIAVQETNNSKVIEVLIEGGANVNAQAETGLTVLTAASTRNSNPEIIEKLISSGANVSAKGDKGVTVLMDAVSENENPEVIKTIIKAGADVNTEDEEGLTALMFAAHYNKPEIIKILLEAGADPSKKDKAGNTAFEYAKHAKHNEKLIDTPIYQKLKVIG